MISAQTQRPEARHTGGGKRATAMRGHVTPFDRVRRRMPYFWRTDRRHWPGAWKRDFAKMYLPLLTNRAMGHGENAVR